MLAGGVADIVAGMGGRGTERCAPKSGNAGAVRTPEAVIGEPGAPGPCGARGIDGKGGGGGLGSEAPAAVGGLGSEPAASGGGLGSEAPAAVGGFGNEPAASGGLGLSAGLSSRCEGGGSE